MRASLLAGLMSIPLMGGPAFALNLVTDGSFEQSSGGPGVAGTFPGWTVGGTINGVGPQSITYGTNATGYGDNVVPDPFTKSPDPSGSKAAYFVDNNSNETLSQAIAVTGGVTYEVGFDFFETLSGAAQADPFTLSASLDGTTLASITSGITYGAGTWYHEFEVFTPGTSSSSSNFTFDFSTVGPDGQDVIVDDVYIEIAPPSDIPEPASMAAFGAGLLGLYWARSRRAPAAMLDPRFPPQPRPRASPVRSALGVDVLAIRSEFDLVRIGIEPIEQLP